MRGELLRERVPWVHRDRSVLKGRRIGRRLRVETLGDYSHSPQLRVVSVNQEA
jgi:hypothetical protein